MAISKALLSYLEKKLTLRVSRIESAGGGSINHVYCLHTVSSKYLIKINNKNVFPGMFDAEARGLNIIRQTNSINVPEVILQDEFGSDSLLVIEWIDNKRPGTESFALLGEKLAQMHLATSDKFGAVADNYMGSLKQSNRSHNNWSDFFIEERFKPMIQIASDKNLLNNIDMENFDELYQKLPNL